MEEAGEEEEEEVGEGEDIEAEVEEDGIVEISVMVTDHL